MVYGGMSLLPALFCGCLVCLWLLVFAYCFSCCGFVLIVCSVCLCFEAVLCGFIIGLHGSCYVCVVYCWWWIMCCLIRMVYFVWWFGVRIGLGTCFWVLWDFVLVCVLLFVLLVFLAVGCCC